MRQATRRLAVVAVLCAGLSLLAPAARAQVQPYLTSDTLLLQLTPLQRAMARANNAVLQDLLAADAQCQAAQSCLPPALLGVVTNAIQVYYAAAVIGGLPPIRSGGTTLDTRAFVGANGTGTPIAPLAADPAQLGEILNWMAPEELLTLGSIATGFARGQLSVLHDRISATRSLSRQRLFAANSVSDALKYGYASNDGIPAGSAGAAFSRLNLFFDVSMGNGARLDSTGTSGTASDTGGEDAFDFHGREYSLGMDWRFSDRLVAGGMLGYADRDVDFNSSQSVVDGNIAANGLSLLAFAQWDDRHFYATGALGYQQLDYDTSRRITYDAAGTDSILASDADTTARAKPHGSALLATLNLGLPLQLRAFGTDLYLRADYQRHSIDAFTERSSGSAPGSTASGFLYSVDSQTIKSFDTAAGVRLQYVFTPGASVVVPFVRGEYHRELEDSPRSLSVTYADFAGLDADLATPLDPTAYTFALTADVPDRSYFSLAAGFSTVIRGSNRVGAAGRGSGGVQAYLQYTRLAGLAHYDRNGTIAGGLRYEF